MSAPLGVYGVIEEIPPALFKGWRRSMKGSMYRRRGGWVATVKPHIDGFRLVLRRVERTCEDCMAVADEVMTGQEND